MYRNAVFSAVTAAIVALSALAVSAPSASASHFKAHPHFSVKFGSCNTWKAVKKAQHFGVWKPHVTFVNHKVVVVKGFKHHKKVKLVFANNPGCHYVW